MWAKQLQRDIIMHDAHSKNQTKAAAAITTTSAYERMNEIVICNCNGTQTWGWLKLSLRFLFFIFQIYNSEIAVINFYSPHYTIFI